MKLRQLGAKNRFETFISIDSSHTLTVAISTTVASAVARLSLIPDEGAGGRVLWLISTSTSNPPDPIEIGTSAFGTVRENVRRPGPLERRSEAAFGSGRAIVRTRRRLW